MFVLKLGIVAIVITAVYNPQADTQGVQTGNFTLSTSSHQNKINITVVFMRCIYMQTVEVEARARTTVASVGYQFAIFPFQLNMLSFEAILERTDQEAGWNVTEINIEWRAYFPSGLYNQPPGYNIFYTHLPSTSLIWTYARDYCIQRGRRLCTAKEICPSGQVLITGTAWGDNWTPIGGSGNNNWLQMGDDNKAAERLCTIHNSRYTPPQWGKISGNCGFSNLVDPCYPRGHVFCCKNSS